MRLAAGLLAALFAAAAPPRASADGPNDNVPDNVRPIPPKGAELPPAVRDEIKAGLTELQQSIKEIGPHELLPDVLVYEKAVRWALDYNEVYDGKGAQPGSSVKKTLREGLERAKLMKAGKTPWATATGYVVRGYRSKIDGSVQPYGVLVPAGYDFAGKEKHRLDFWWHGRGETLSEANFIANQQTANGIIPAAGAFILFPYGRYCNANKFAGEIDTLECLEHVKKHYPIDESRIAARGFSMGGAACWQFAVHFPTLWAAAAPGAGFAETREFLNDFQNEKVKPEWWERKLWRWYDATDYAQNLYNLPTVAYSGEIDRQKQAADVMAREMRKVGLELTHIIGPKTAHAYEKGAKEEINKRIDAIVEKGRDPWPKEIKFVTYTLRYNECGWVRLFGLEKHWEPATLVGKQENGKVTFTTKGITTLAVKFDITQKATITIDGQDVLSMDGHPGAAPSIMLFHKECGKWSRVVREKLYLGSKWPGRQGPIDDAFTDRFLMVKPTGTPLNEKVGAWAAGEMKHAIEHWRKQFRGDAPVKDDSAITAEDIASSNLILWGDPSSNSVLAKIADKLPVKWTKDGVKFGDQTYDAGTHVPVLIYPNPLNPQKYVVLNSGFTFREYDYLNNARQVPKLPDYAVLDVTTPPNSRWPGKVVRAGFFGEKWELLPDDGK
jgi:hypothetical protein